MILQLLVQVLHPELDRHRRLVLPAYLAAFVAIGIALASSGAVAGATRTSWGWAMVPGSAHLAIYALVATIPAWVVGSWLLRRAGRPWVVRRRLSSVERGGLLCFGLGTLTDALLPAFDVPFPRLGGAGLVAWGGVVWWAIYRTRDPRLAPQRFAREILETLPDAVALVRLDGRIRSGNERLATLADRSVSHLLGTSIDELLQGETEHRGDERESEAELQTGSGEHIPVSVSRSPLADGEGRAVGRVLVIRDLREIVSLRSRLAGSGRLVAVGQLAAGIAHEINNPVAYVGANLRFLSVQWEQVEAALTKPRGPAAGSALEEGPELLREACEGLDRVAAIVRDVGSFTGGTRPERASADLAELLDAAARVAAPQLADARIERDYSERPRVPCVTQELMQVFLNLLVNAGQALGPDGTIRLSTRTQGDEAVVEVADDGAGIPEDLVQRIFEPFFTTKPIGEGTGLGLPISQQIVSRHGGSIRVESELGRGTRFSVRLPAEASQLPAEASQLPAEGTPSRVE
jgi:PAS domain S-box-containing protein